MVLNWLLKLRLSLCNCEIWEGDRSKMMKDKATISDGEQDFFSLAGMWENRNVTTESIRQKAWREDKNIRDERLSSHDSY
jgi:hypothetical protein